MSRTYRAAVFVTAMAAAMAMPVGRASAQDPGGTLGFKHTTLNPGGVHPELCLSFDSDLGGERAQTLARSVTLTPSAPFTPRVEGHDFCLGGLSYDTRYAVAVARNFADAKGHALAAPLALTAAFGDRPSMVAISGAGYVLPRQGATGLAVQTVNVVSVRVHVYRLARAAVGRTLADSYPRIDVSATTLEPYAFRTLLDQNLTGIWHGSMDTPGARNADAETALPLRDIVAGRPPGFYLVVAEDAARPAAASAIEAADAGRSTDDDPGIARDDAPIAAHWINLSDIGLSAIRGADGLHVSARSYATGLPLRGVGIALIARGGDTLGTAATGADGQAVLDAGLLRGRHGAEPVMLQAQLAEDFTLLRLDRPWFDFSDRGADGRAATSGPRALLETDRGIYRPGETIRLVTLLRDGLGAAVDQPLTLVLRRLDSVEVKRVRLEHGLAGGFATPIALSATAPRGSWRVDALLDPTAPPIGTVSFDVQDFVPQILATTLSAPPAYTAGQPAELSVSARYLYGAPGAGLHGEGDYHLQLAAAPVAGYADWAFGLENETLPDVSGALDVPDADAQGTSHVPLAPQIPPGLTRPLELAVRAGFADPGGRVVAQKATLAVRRAGPLIGLRVHPGDGSGDKTAVPIEIVAFDPDGHPAALAHAHWTLSRVNHLYDWIFHDGSWSFNEHKVDVPVDNGTVDLRAAGPAKLAPSLDWGDYRLTVADPATGAASSTSFFVGWASAGAETNTPDRLPVSVRSADLAPGGQTVLHVGGGFAGRAQVTIATDRVLSSRSIEIGASGADVPLTATADWGPGVYALVTLYRPLNGTLRPHDPVRAVGLTWIGVNQKSHLLGVALHAPQVALPRGRLSVPVDVTLPQGAGGGAGGPVYLSVSAVDEGVLDLTGFHQPDLFAALFGKRRLGVDLLDGYGALLLSNAPVGRIREGGDSGDSAAGLAVTTRKTVALFAGVVTLDAQGHGQVTFDVPDFEGQLHLMATAWTAAALGTAQADVTIRDPVFADLALPRFVAPGDSAQPLVSSVNTDAPAGDYAVALHASGPIHIDGPASFHGQLAVGARRDDRFTLVADGVGVGHVEAVLTRAGTTAPLLTREWSIESRQGHQAVTLSHGGDFAPGAHEVLDAHLLDGFDAASAKITLGVSAVGGIDVPGFLQTLEARFWGDSESLAAQARPLLQLTNPSLLGTGQTRESIRKTVQSAIDTLFDRQDASGRIGAWRLNDGAGLTGLQDYVADFLIRARDGGYDVPAARLGLLLDQIESRQLQSSATDEQESRDVESGQNLRAYAAYVLARAGRLHPGAIRDLAAALTQRRQDGRTQFLWGDGADDAAQPTPIAIGHVAVALRLDDAAPGQNGDADDQPGHLFDQASDALGPRRQGRPGVFDFGYWVYLRDLAGLSALVAESGDQARSRALLERYRDLSLSPEELDGQEQAAILEAVSALNRQAKGAGLRIGGQAPADALVLPAAYPVTASALAGGVAVDNSGQIGLYRTVTVRAVPSRPVGKLSLGIDLSVRGVGMDGKPVDLSHLRQNDRFIVVLEGGASRGQYHLGVSAPLPAGWEIEGPVRPNDDTYKFLGDRSATRVAEARDDRFVAAFDLDADGGGDDTDAGKLANGRFRIAYVVRAVTPGRFLLPEILVSDIRRPAMLGRTASGTTEIAPR